MVFKSAVAGGVKAVSSGYRFVLILLLVNIWPACSTPAEFTPFAERAVPVRPLHYRLDVDIDFDKEKMLGRAEIAVGNSGKDKAEYVPVLMYRLLKATSVLDESRNPLPFDQRVLAFEDFDRLQVNYLEIRLPSPIEPGTEKTVVIEYEGYLLGASESGMRYVKDRIDPEFTILRSDAFAFPCVGFPSFFAQRAAGLPAFDWEGRITVPEGLVVANGGKLIERQVNDGKATYRYRSIRPSWRMDFAVAAYQVIEAEGLQVFHSAEDREGALAAAEAFQRAFDTLSEWFGPLHDFQSFTILELPEGYGGQVDVTCILQTADAFRDPERAFLIYHEVTHLWNVTPTDLPAPRWEEGLAVFLQWLMTDDFAEMRGELLSGRMDGVADRLRNRLERDPEVREVPLIDYGRKEMTDLSYSVGALMFAMIFELVGPQEFNTIVGDFYQHHWRSGASTDDFVAFANSHSDLDLTSLFNDWIYTPAFVEMVDSELSVRSMAERYR